MLFCLLFFPSTFLLLYSCRIVYYSKQKLRNNEIFFFQLTNFSMNIFHTKEKCKQINPNNPGCTEDLQSSVDDHCKAFEISNFDADGWCASILMQYLMERNTFLSFSLFPQHTLSSPSVLFFRFRFCVLVIIFYIRFVSELLALVVPLLSSSNQIPCSSKKKYILQC